MIVNPIFHWAENLDAIKKKLCYSKNKTIWENLLLKVGFNVTFSLEKYYDYDKVLKNSLLPNFTN